MNRNSILYSFVLLTAITTATWGQEFENSNKSFRKENYSFIKEVKPISNIERQEWGAFDLDEDIYRSSFYNDIRLVQKGRLVPYSRKLKYDKKGKEGSVSPRVVFEDIKEKQTTYVLEIPSIPANTEMKSLELQVSGNFEAQARILMGNQIDNWSKQKSAFVYKYQLKNLDQGMVLDLNERHFRYIRLEFDTGNSVFFPRVNYGLVEKISEIEFTPEIPSPENNSDVLATVYYFPNMQSSPFQRVELEFEEKNYNRRYKLSYMGREKEYNEISSGSLVSNQKTKTFQNSIQLWDTVSSAWKLEIFYDDDTPIHLKSVKLYHPKEIILFSLDSLDSDLQEYPLQLYYGYKYATKPSFDLTGFPENDSTRENFRLGDAAENPDQSLSLLHPPASIWVIRILFLLGIAGVGALSYRVFQKWEKVNS